MKVSKLADMTRGWYVGNFAPAAFITEHCEAACKSYQAGESEQAHYHKVATEINLIVSGKAKFNDTEAVAGDIVIVEPDEVIAFSVLEDTVTVCVKVPSVAGDKYLV